MKTIKIIALEELAVDMYSKNLGIFFEEHFKIEGISIKGKSFENNISADLIVISNKIIHNYVKSVIEPNSEILYLEFSFKKDEVNKLRDIPPGSDVLIVDYTEYMAITLMSQLNEYGIQHLNLIPYSPDTDLNNISNYQYAITPGLKWLIPDSIDTIFDIGYRQIDVNSITGIISRFGLPHTLFDNKILDYSKKLIHKNKSVEDLIHTLEKEKVHIEAIMNNIDDGVMVIDEHKRIRHCSKHLCKLLGDKSGNCLNGLGIFHECCNQIIELGEVENKIIDLPEINTSVAISKRKLEYESESYIVLVRDLRIINDISVGIRKNLVSKGHVAKYQFEDIIYQSNTMKDLVHRAKKISTFDSSVLINGKTGTGKELFAHSIHNSSKRKKEPFLAINCAALSETLLDSELFGYEEGSFTGAKKGGKKGLFELAHHGTLFLDELSSISPHMQVKLLRVLQEKEIMKIGGTNIIPVDVRIIASSNENLAVLIKQGKFREDLYYRLNSFMINIPSLNQRVEDIFPLIDYFLRSSASTIELDGPLKNYLTQYEWPGNIRELKNCINYMMLMCESNTLSLKDLPQYMLQDTFEDINLLSKPNVLFDDEEEIMNFILDILKQRKLGRRTLLTILNKNGYLITEYKLRKILELMKDNNMIVINKGKKGISVI